MQEKTQFLILKAALKEVVINGWSDESLRIACENIGFNANCYKLYYPQGIAQIVEGYFDQLDLNMVESIKLFKNNGLKVRERIKQALIIRLELMAKDRILTQKTMSFLAMPWNIRLGLKRSWRTADLIWHEAANDHSADFNYYTKRSLLAVVYMATITYFLSDFSPNHKDTIDFLERKLDNINNFGKFISRFK